MIMKRFFYILAALAAYVPVAGQNLDPTVEVSRSYEGKLVEMHKPALVMTVPDSVQRFDLDFDYSVFDSPYKGAYEFRPYLLDFRPSAHVDDSKKLYLRAGAGYRLHPELDVVWSPLSGRKFKMDVYASHRSYIGRYLPVEGVRDSDWKGYALYSRAGADGHLNLDKLRMGFDVGYLGTAQDDFMRRRSYNALDMSLDIASRSLKDEYFHYDFNLDYRLAGDDLRAVSGVRNRVMENDLGMDLSLGQVFRRSHRVLFDIELDAAFYTGGFDASAALFSLVPHYVFNKGRWNLDLGVRISVLNRPDAEKGFFSTGGQVVYPDAKVRFSVMDDALDIFAAAGGGNRLNTYGSLMERNPHFDMSYGAGMYDLLDNTVERINAVIGVEGRISSRFSYCLKGGYSNFRNTPMDAVFKVGTDGGVASVLLPGVAYTACSSLFAEFDFLWKSEWLQVDGTMSYDGYRGMDMESGIIAPAAFTGDVSVEYNWRKRIFAGVGCEFATDRHGRYYSVKGYADLSLYAEYAVNRKWSFWAKGGNLLFMPVQRNPFYAEKGGSFTLGICLNL